MPWTCKKCSKERFDGLQTFVRDGYFFFVCFDCLRDHQYVCEICKEEKPNDNNLKDFDKTMNVYVSSLSTPPKNKYTMYYQCVTCEYKSKVKVCRMCYKLIEFDRYKQNKATCLRCSITIQQEERENRTKKEVKRLKLLCKFFKQYENTNVNEITNVFTDWLLKQ